MAVDEVFLRGREGKWGDHVQSPLSFAVGLLEMGSWRVLGETGRLAIKISSVKFGLGVNDCAVHPTLEIEMSASDSRTSRRGS